MSRRPSALLLIVMAGSLLSVMVSIAVNLATADNLPEPFARYEKLAWPIVLVLTVATVALAVWERLAQQRANSLAQPPRSTAPPPKQDVERERPLHNLPLQLTSFVGRERELGEVRRLLSSHRLLTLTGAGGCGKTRLALETAAQLVDAYPDGVWLVELAALNDPALVPQAVASTLGLREEPGRSVTALLCGHLQDREVLLVLDNCEHLVAACAELAQSLLRTCPKLHILATSREHLGAQGETTWQVPSLEVPAAGHNGARELLGQYEAVRLFAERAAAARPSFQLDEENAAAVAQICRRLDGIPLAIELAAARVKGLPAQQIAARLDDRFRLLSAGIRTAPPRHQTLHAALDWSYGLLSQREQVLFKPALGICWWVRAGGDRSSVRR